MPCDRRQVCRASRPNNRVQGPWDTVDGRFLRPANSFLLPRNALSLSALRFIVATFLLFSHFASHSPLVRALSVCHVFLHSLQNKFLFVVMVERYKVKKGFGFAAGVTNWPRSCVRGSRRRRSSPPSPHRDRELRAEPLIPIQLHFANKKRDVPKTASPAEKMQTNCCEEGPSP